MLHRTALAFFAVLALSCLTATAAIASTKCLCNNGVIVQSMQDDGDDDDCNDACDALGGGRVWRPSDAQSESGGDENAVRPRAGDGVRPASPPASRRQR